MREGEGPTMEKGQPGIGVSIPRAALFGLCPECGARTLFEAPARIAFKCDACGLELAELERGGRLAGLLTILVALVLSGAAFAVENAFRPPLWLQAAFWAPVTIFAVIAVLRLFKTALLYRQYDAAIEREQAVE